MVPGTWYMYILYKTELTTNNYYCRPIKFGVGNGLLNRVSYGSLIQFLVHSWFLGGISNLISSKSIVTVVAFVN